MPPDFDALITLYSGPLLAYLWRMLRDRADAEDCLQDTFLRAFRSRGRLEGHANPQAWLYRIATNTARTRLRQRARGAARTAELDPELAASPAAGTAEQAAQRVLLAAAARATEALPHQQRAALILRKYQEQSYAAIAAILDCSEAAARANVYQALKKLRAALETDEVAG